MQGFNGKLKSKNELNQYTKEQLIDMYWDYTENTKKLIDYIFNCPSRAFEEIKYFWNATNSKSLEELIKRREL